MKVEIIKKDLVITIPLQTPAPSKSGKTLIVATTSGIQPTSVAIDNKVVMLGLNAYIKK